jgi:hypothetical protein
MMAPLVRLRPAQFFKVAAHYSAARPLLASLPSAPARIVVTDNADGSVGNADAGAADPAWQQIGLYVRRLGWEASNRDPEYLALWLQVRAPSTARTARTAARHTLFRSRARAHTQGAGRAAMRAASASDASAQPSARLTSARVRPSVYPSVRPSATPTGRVRIARHELLAGGERERAGRGDGRHRQRR